MLRVGCKGFTRKTLEANFAVGKAGRLKKGIRVETLVTHSK